MDRYCPRCFKEFSEELDTCPDDGTRLVANVEESLVGRTLDDRYEVLSKLGQGGMGVVYIAEQAMIGRKVALKVLRMEMVRDKSSVQRFLVEAKAIASLRSAHTITLHDFGVTKEGLLYYTMELLEGTPLSDLVKKQGPMPYRRAADIILQTLDSLEEAHDAGIMHRDLKPDNLFVSQHRGQDHVSVLDFGIAKLVGDSSMDTITKTGMICGTPAYLSPEQAMGHKVTTASDIYSLGIVFYELLAGSPPFQKTTAMEVLMSHVNETPQLVNVKNPEVRIPAAIDRLIQKALAKKAEDRIGTAVQFRRELEAALSAAQEGDKVSLAPMATGEAGTRTLAGLQETAVTPVPAPAARIEVPDESADGDGARVATDGDGARVEPRGGRGVLVGAAVGAGVALVVLLALWQPWAGTEGAAPEQGPATTAAGPVTTAGDGQAAQTKPPVTLDAGSPAPVDAGSHLDVVQKADLGSVPDVSSAPEVVLADTSAPGDSASLPEVHEVMASREDATAEATAADVRAREIRSLAGPDIRDAMEAKEAGAGSKKAGSKKVKKKSGKKKEKKKKEKKTDEKKSSGLKFRDFGGKKKEKKGLEFRPVK